VFRNDRLHISVAGCPAFVWETKLSAVGLVFEARSTEAHRPSLSASCKLLA
jgi:hypothetical protein